MSLRDIYRMATEWLQPVEVTSHFDELMNKFKWLLKFICFSSACFLGAFLFGHAADSYNKRAAEEEKRSVGVEASATGALIAAAFKGCLEIGVSDFYSCAQHKGPLIEDQTAPRSAQVALNKLDDYNVVCQRHYPPQYCANLLDRAIQISIASKK